MPALGRPRFLDSAILAMREIREAFDCAEVGFSPEAAADFYAALDEVTAQALMSLPPRPMPSSPSSPDDPTAREREIERSLRIIQHSMEHAPIGIFRLDADGAVVYANAAACRALGYPLEELLRLKVFDFDPSFTPATWHEHRALTRATGSRTLISSHRRRDGTVFPVEITVKQFVFEGQIFSLSFVKDISERVQAEQERRELESRMLQAQKLESLGVLAGGIAHDFNNLLTVITGNLELVQRDPIARGARPMLEEIGLASRQAAELCRQLLIYSGKGESHVQPVELSSLLREQVQMLEVFASRSVQVVLELAEDLPQIQGDAGLLRQVFMNLIINASDAIGDAAGTVTITTGAADLDETGHEDSGQAWRLRPGSYVFAQVADTGCGMSDDVRARIFDPFFSTKTKGRGLGLAAVRGIVHKHGGGIQVTSELGRGTTFRLLFPVADPAPQAAVAAPLEGECRGSGLVLLVDDQSAVRELGARMLAHLGFEVVVAGNGREALARFHEYRERVGFVVLDWTMPEMTGSETLTALRDLAPDLPVILTSGHAPEDIACRLGSDRHLTFLPKPYGVDELERAFRGLAPRQSSATRTP